MSASSLAPAASDAHRWWASPDPREARMGALARSGQAVDMREARVLAWLRDQALAEVGYFGWQAFCRERVDWSDAWIRDLVRLVRSGLTRVIEAACRDELPLTVAVKAPAACDVETEEVWLAAALAGMPPSGPKRRPSGASFTVATGEQDTLLIWHARHKARLWVGDEASDRRCDDFILQKWRERDGEAVVAEGLAPPPKPTPARGPFEWAVPDPATPLLGEWRTPASLEEGLALLAKVQAARRSHVVELGRLYEEVTRRGLHRVWGFRRIEDFCAMTLGCSARTMQRSRRLAEVLREFPALEALPLTKAEAIGRVAKASDVERWVAVAGRVGVLELQRAVAHVEAGSEAAAELLGTYERAMAETTTSVALEQVRRPVPPPLTDRVHPDLPVAAAWFMAEVRLPERRGFGKVVVRLRYACENPECGVRTPRLHTHHIFFRRKGGTHRRENLCGACPACHLRGIHAGRLKVARKRRRTVWTYPDRVVTVFAKGSV